MKFLSVCSGIEAASVAFKPLKWEALAFSEIEAFPRAVLAHHYPGVPIHGDFTELKTQRWIADADMLCGGTPCQAFSVAGLRQSLSDDRGNLTMQFVLLANAIDAFRHDAGREPAWILWENVPGVLSTTDNAFGAFLGGLCGCDAPLDEPEGGWTRAGVVAGPARCAAWRVLDAQHFGLAQRRQRVFVLARGGAGRWAAADALLPIIEGMRWHPAPGRGKGEGVAGTVAASPPSRRNGGSDPTAGHFVAHTLRGEGFDASEDGTGRGVPLVPQKWPAEIAPTLNAHFGDKQGLEDQHALNGAGLFVPTLMRMPEGKEGGGKGPLVSSDQSLTMATANDQVLAVRTANTNANGHGIADGVAHTLDSAQGQAVAFMENFCGEVRVSEQMGALTCGGGKPGQGYPAVQLGMQVRRLTPRECERLQGFPDDYTDIPWRGKPHAPDGPRYKALGNSWAVPVVRWIGEQMARVERMNTHP